MGSSSAAPAQPGSTTLTRALCALILVLMLAAAVYGAVMAFRYFGHIGV